MHLDTIFNRACFLKQGTLAGLALAQYPLLQANSSAYLGSHHKAKIKRVIHLCMAGGASHLETFDFKQKLRDMDGKAMPDSFTKGQQLAQLQKQGNRLKVLGPQHAFKRYGQSGQEISSIFPHIGSIADDISIVKSMYTEQINHDPAHTFMNTGSIIPGRPSMGSWVLHALGNASPNLPGFVVLTSAGGAQGQPISSKQWHNGFLPGRCQGVEFQAKGDPIQYVHNPKGVDKTTQGEVVGAINQLNSLLKKKRLDDEIQTRMSQVDLAYRMQTSVPDLIDLSNEPKHIIDLYGCIPGDGSYASNCLLARRLAERGVRFIQLYHRGWDHHGGIKKGIATTANLVDQGTAALIKDLKQRGMLDDTLIIWGGEFGRTPMAQGDGRDHHILAFSVFLAGGGIKGGMSFGKTDELGYKVVENKTSVHDLHATMLHLLGIDHERLSFKFQGLDQRLTGVEPCKILKDILS